jgi:non-canonical purine NTP pyrophosphatase (RdgB/HAM1 family)
MPQTIFFLTTNQYKYEQFLSVVSDLSFNRFTFEQLPEDSIEIQADNNRDISAFSSKWASDKFQLPIIKEDVGFYIESLAGFPGPYLSQVEKQIKSNGFLQLLENAVDRRAHWEYSVSICFPDQEPVTFSAIQNGYIASGMRGNSGWYADKIFVMENQTKTISELLDDRTYKRNNDHYIELIKYLKNIK